MKKNNKIQIKERLRSLFYARFQREERRRKSKLGERKNNSKRRKEEEETTKEKEKEAPKKAPKKSPLRVGSHCLTELAITCLGQPTKPFKHFY